MGKDNNWGGGDSNRKAAILEEGLITMFKTKKELYRDEVEDYLADFLDDNFATYTEDGSPGQVAEVLVQMFTQCGKFNFTLANAAIERGTKHPGVPGRASGAARSMPVARGDDDSSSDEEGGSDHRGAPGLSPGVTSAMAEGARAGGMDVEGEEESAGAVGGPDPDGWETVTSKKKGKGGRR
ncbi:unnamed protein product [Choristocarpus tenellus]